MAFELDVALLMTASRSLAQRKFIVKMFSKLTASWMITLAFAVFNVRNIVWLSWRYFLKYKDSMALSAEKAPSPYSRLLDARIKGKKNSHHQSIHILQNNTYHYIIGLYDNEDNKML